MDIVEKLRGLPIVVTENGRTGMSRMGGALLSEAADEIERLREALQLIALGDEFGITKQGFANLIAKNALQQKDSE